MFLESYPNCPEFKKNNRDSIIFFLQLQIEFYFFPLKGTTLFYLPLKFQKLIHIFEASSLPKLPKIPFWDFGPLGINVQIG
jgi:hypothetical protein